MPHTQYFVSFLKINLRKFLYLCIKYDIIYAEYIYHVLFHFCFHIQEVFMPDQNNPNTLPDAPTEDAPVEQDILVEDVAPEQDVDIADIEPVGDGDITQTPEPQEQKKKSKESL